MDHIRRKRRHKRIQQKVSGTASRPRAAVSRSTGRISVQLIDDDKNTTILSAYSKAKKGKTKTRQAEEVGAAIAKLASEKGISAIVFDRSGYRYHGRVKAVAEAMRSHGLTF